MASQGTRKISRMDFVGLGGFHHRAVLCTIVLAVLAAIWQDSI